MDDFERACSCGCGAPVATARRYVRGHNLRGTGSGSWIEQGRRFLWVDGRRIAEHRYVVEQALGRKLLSPEIVHHIDGDPLNNDLSNLVIVTRSEHARLHFAGKKVKRWTDDERLRAKSLYLSGLTVDEVAVALARPYDSTLETLQRLGCTRTPTATRNLRREAFERIFDPLQLPLEPAESIYAGSKSPDSSSSLTRSTAGDVPVTT